MVYDVEIHSINYHIKNIFVGSALEEFSYSNISNNWIDNKAYITNHYN